MSGTTNATPPTTTRLAVPIGPISRLCRRGGALTVGHLLGLHHTDGLAVGVREEPDHWPARNLVGPHRTCAAEALGLSQR